MKDIFKLYFSLLPNKKRLFKTKNMGFPVIDIKGSYLSEILSFKGHNKKYFTKTIGARSKYITLDARESMNCLLEIFPGEIVNSYREIDICEDSLLPVCFQCDEGKAIVKSNNTGKQKIIKGFNNNGFYYIRLFKNDKFILNNSKAIIGDPIRLNDKASNKKLLLMLYIDGLSMYFLKKKCLVNAMPNTNSFFSKGIVFNNCYANGEWSLPSAAHIFTGTYTHNNKIFHPRLDHIVGKDRKILSEHMQEKGYLCLHIGANLRKSPAYGYVKGFDRTVYKPDMLASEAITSLIEHLYSFPNRSHFVWIDLFDLHKCNYAKNIPSIGSQVMFGLKEHNYVGQGKKSVFTDYDESMIGRYEKAIKKLDAQLDILYSYIEKNYTEKDITVMLCSDHGQAYLSADKYVLSESRCNVPFMIRGMELKNIENNEFVENVDIYAAILKHAGIYDAGVNVDGKVPRSLGSAEKRNYAFSESLFPGQTYKAVIRDSKYEYRLESEFPVNDNGTVSLGRFNSMLLLRENYSIVGNSDILNAYEALVLEKIKRVGTYNNILNK